MTRALLVPGLLLLAACSHEPVRAPQIPPVEQYTQGPVVTRLSGADAPGVPAQELVPGKDIPAQWWSLFRSPTLDRLVREALDGSPTVARAVARLRQAQEDLAARSDATSLPRVDGKLSANRVNVEPDSLGGPGLPIPMPLNLYLATVNVSYTFDFFGATRNELAALRADVDYQRYQLEAARLALAANVVTAAIREASLRQQLADAGEAIELQARQVGITEQMEKAGGASQADLAAQRGDLAKARASLPDLQRSLEQARHRLAIYTGRPPSAPDLPQFSLAEIRLPAELPLSLPSQLARQRPDIRAAEALLAQAGAKVGVATANLYPQVTLSAQVGSLADTPSNLLKSSTLFYLLGASLTQPLFHGGELQARRRSALAAYDQAAAAYRETVLKGFQDVADTLRALEADAAKLRDRADAAARASDYERITAARFQAGGVSQSAWLEAQRRLRQARLDEARAAADRYADSAALLQALGGGWWHEDSTVR